MGFFELIIIGAVALTIVDPLAKAIGRRIAAEGTDGRELKRLKAELAASEQRLADLESRLISTEDRLDFQEKLLQSRPSDSRS